MGTAGNAEVLIAEPARKRRHRSKRERREVVEETLQPGASVAVIARRHGVNANQVSIGASFIAKAGSMWNRRQRNWFRCGSPS